MTGCELCGKEVKTRLHMAFWVCSACMLNSEQFVADAALGAAVRKNVAKMSYVGTPEGLRELASYIADPHLPESEAAYSLLHCVADALEAEGASDE